MFIENTEILYKENFLTDEELAILDETINSHQEVIDAMPTNGGYQTLPVELVSFIKKISYRVFQLIADEYGADSIQKIYPRDEIQFLKENSGMGAHDDAEGQNVSHGAVIYLTDTADYDGGELFYPKLDLTIKPERGSIAIHPRTEPYTHGVNVVTRGTRYVLVMFAS